MKLFRSPLSFFDNIFPEIETILVDNCRIQIRKYAENSIRPKISEHATGRGFIWIERISLEIIDRIITTGKEGVYDKLRKKLSRCLFFFFSDQ